MQEIIVLSAAAILRQTGIFPTPRITDRTGASAAVLQQLVLFAEECVEWGSIGEHLAYCLQQAGWNGTFLHAAVHTANLPHATVPQIKQVTGLDADTLAQQVMDAWMKGENIS